VLKKFDDILYGTWKICECLLRVAFTAIAVCWYILIAVLKVLFSMPGLRKFADFAEHMVLSKPARAVGARVPAMWTSFASTMDASPVLRRIVLPVVAVLAVLWISPPSHWGPWYEYQRGTASYYSTGFWFRKTANLEIFLPFRYTAAHKSLPFNTMVKVVNSENGRTVYVRINDRGPYVKNRIIDLSAAAAEKIGIYKKGTGRVIIYTRKRLKE